MKKRPLKTAVLLLTLTFNSCSRVEVLSTHERLPATTAPKKTKINTPSGCYQLINGFFPPSQEIWYLLSSEPQSILAYSREFRNTELTEFEKDWLISSIRDLPDDDEFRRKLRSAIFYARTLSDKQKTEFYDHLEPWIKSNQRYNGHVMNNFLWHYKRVTKFEDSIYEIEMKKLSHVDEQTRLKRSKKVAHEKARVYEHNYYRCMNAVADPTQVTKEGLKRANTVALGITFGGAGSALITYGATNYDKEKDAAWWSEIGFVILTSMAMGYVNSKWILANPRLKLWTQRFPLVMGAAAVEDIAVTALWGELLGGEPPSHEEVKKLLADKEFQAKMQAFLVWLEEESDFDAHYEKISKLFDFYKVDTEFNSEASEENLSSLDPAEIDLEETMNHLVAALSDYEYEQKKGRVSLGDEDYDRYAFHRAIDLVYQPAFIVASQLMYGSLCANPNPKLGVVKAMAIFVAINLAADGLYFVSRRGLINQ